jgi:hypothetical protein
MDETLQKSVYLRCEGWWPEEDCWPNPSGRCQGRLILARKPLKRARIEEGRNPTGHGSCTQARGAKGCGGVFFRDCAWVFSAQNVPSYGVQFRRVTAVPRSACVSKEAPQSSAS